jgi:hypothetical protein
MNTKKLEKFAIFVGEQLAVADFIVERKLPESVKRGVTEFVRKGATTMILNRIVPMTGTGVVGVAVKEGVEGVVKDLLKQRQKHQKQVKSD